MVRTADHSARRQQVAEALMRAVETHGMTDLTLAHVAHEAGVSVGLVQRYFRTKSELLRFGVEHLYARTIERMRQVPTEPPLRSMLVRMLETNLPLDAERRRESAVWLAFIPATLTDPELSRIHRKATRELVGGVRQILTAAQRNGELSTAVSAGAQASALVALVDGLVVNQMATRTGYGAKAVRAALSDHIDRLFDEETR